MLVLRLDWPEVNSVADLDRASQWLIDAIQADMLPRFDQIRDKCRNIRVRTPDGYMSNSGVRQVEAGERTSILIHYREVMGLHYPG
jgi:hypothetical protein